MTQKAGRGARLRPYATVNGQTGRVYRSRESPIKTALRYHATRRAAAEETVAAIDRCRTRQAAVDVIDCALLLAWIAGRNACVLETSRRRIPTPPRKDRR